MHTTTLESILDKNPLICPSLRNKDILATTRDIAPYDEKLPENKRIHATYLQKNLVDQLLLRARERAQKVKFTDKDADKAAVMDVQLLEKTLCAGLPGIINSEMDIQTLLQFKFIAPALSGIAMEKRSRGTDGKLESTDPIIQPVICSSPNFKNTPIPDGILFDSVVSEGEKGTDKSWIEKARCTLEYKSPTVVDNMDMEPLENECEKPTASKKFRAVPFVHPKEGDNRSLDTYGKVLCQLNSQMHAFEVQYGIVSSYHHTMFYCRKKVEGFNVLYHSDRYSYEGITPLHFFAWFLLCLEGSEDFKLKDIEIENIRHVFDDRDNIPKVGLTTGSDGSVSEPKNSPPIPNPPEDKKDSDYIPSPSLKKWVASNPERRIQEKREVNKIIERINDDSNDNNETLEREVSYLDTDEQTNDNSPGPPSSPTEVESENEDDHDLNPEQEVVDTDDIVDSQRSPITKTGRTNIRRVSFEEPALFDRDDHEDPDDDSHGSNYVRSTKPPSDSLLSITEERTEETGLEEEIHHNESSVDNSLPVRSSAVNASEKKMEKKNVQRKRQSGQGNSNLVSSRQLEKQPERLMTNLSRGESSRPARRRGGEIRKTPADTSKPVSSSPEHPKLHSEEKRRDLGPKDPGGSKGHYQRNVSRRAGYSKTASKKTEAIPGGEEIYIRDKGVGEDEGWEGESEKESG